MALYNVVVRGTYASQVCINTYSYLSSGVPAAVSGSFGLVDAMGYRQGVAQTVFTADTLASAVQEAVVPAFAFTDILVQNPYDPLDFYSTNFLPNTVGTDGVQGVGAPPFTAMGFRSNKTRTDINPGQKRYAGIGEGHIAAAGIIEADFVGNQMQEIAERLGEVISYDDEGNAITYAPIIVSKEAYVTPGGNRAYQLYPTEAEQLDHIMASITWSPKGAVRSQVSRQYGRGY